MLRYKALELPLKHRAVVAGSGLAKACLTFPHSLDLVISNQRGGSIDSLYPVHRKCFPVPFMITAHARSFFNKFSYDCFNLLNGEKQPDDKSFASSSLQSYRQIPAFLLKCGRSLSQKFNLLNVAT
jgi:hypothetical protein